MSDIDEYDSDNNSISSTDSSVSKEDTPLKLKLSTEEEDLVVVPEEDEEVNEDDAIDDFNDEIDLDEDADEGEEVDNLSDDDEILDGEENNDPDEYNMIGGVKKTNKKENNLLKKEIIINNNNYSSDEDDNDEEDEDEKYLQKFNNELNNNYLVNYHPEYIIHNYDEISALTHVIRDNNNNIMDDLHKTIPFLTKYEKARVLGQRAKQINSGSKPFIKVPDNVIDGYVIGELELQQKKIPFIIRRPIPGGGSEYWKLSDLEIITF